MESARVSVDYGFDQLRLDKIFAAAHIENIASNKIIQNLGFNFVYTFECDKEVHKWYKLEK